MKEELFTSGSHTLSPDYDGRSSAYHIDDATIEEIHAKDITDERYTPTKGRRKFEGGGKYPSGKLNANAWGNEIARRAKAEIERGIDDARKKAESERKVKFNPNVIDRSNTL